MSVSNEKTTETLIERFDAGQGPIPGILRMFFTMCFQLPSRNSLSLPLGQRVEFQVSRSQQIGEYALNLMYAGTRYWA